MHWNGDIDIDLILLQSVTHSDASYNCFCCLCIKIWKPFSSLLPISRVSGSLEITITVKFGDKEQTGVKELFTEYQPFPIINLLLDKEFLPIFGNAKTWSLWSLVHAA